MSIMQRLLILAPHTDDAELGCGGSMVRLLENNKEIFIAVFSTAEESLPPEASSSTLREEFFEATQSLGIPHDNVFVYGYPVRRLSHFRQEVLEELVKLRQRLNPDAVLLPSQSDLHQDHQVVHAEGLRAFKDVTVWGYELPWNHITFSAQAFVTLEHHHIESKWRALKAYRSQIELNRPYFSWDFVESLARVRGTQVKAQYAEAFDVVRIRI